MSGFVLVLAERPLLFFSFYSAVGLPDLHSFPTRRSSDLARSSRAGKLQRGRRRLRRVWSDAVRQPYASKTTDRKSTRLNSSHANISYAVFCLKKKKNWQCHATRCH